MQLCSRFHSATVCTPKSLASKFCSRHTNLVVNPHIKVSGCDTAESGKYLQTFRMNLLPPPPEYSSALKMETAGSLKRC